MGRFAGMGREAPAALKALEEGWQKISGNAGPFVAPAIEWRIRGRDRMYRVLGSRPPAPVSASG
ncbi:hypothetical protein [Streptomyces sp. SID13726]|uniref:hypothetical protein n=1 Tax=Streptomyces sp. SID13726 TaxID=2706058 RepID=UPI001EF31907|nr:hypothetical protein [Streptomyces sp. SID13726]